MDRKSRIQRKRYCLLRYVVYFSHYLWWENPLLVVGEIQELSVDDPLAPSSRRSQTPAKGDLRKFQPPCPGWVTEWVLFQQSSHPLHYLVSCFFYQFIMSDRMWSCVASSHAIQRGQSKIPSIAVCMVARASWADWHACWRRNVSYQHPKP